MRVGHGFNCLLCKYVALFHIFFNIPDSCTHKLYGWTCILRVGCIFLQVGHVIRR